MSPGAHEVRDCFCLHSRRAARQLTQFYDRALRPCGLRVTQFQLLSVIGGAEPVTQQTLSDLLSMDRTTLTRNLALLQRDGLVDIEQGVHDRREHHHRLTLAGRNAVSEALPLWQSVQESLSAHLRTEGNLTGQTTVLQLLDKLSAFGAEHSG